MKRRSIIICLLLFAFGFKIVAEGNEPSKVNIMTLSTSVELNSFSHNDYTYFEFRGDIYSTVTEISPIDKEICKLVFAVPVTRQGNYIYYTIFVKIGDLISVYCNGTRGTGIVSEFDYNHLEFVMPIYE